MTEIPLTIALDRDDVLIDLNTGLQKFHNHHFGTNLGLEDIHTFDLSEVWRCTPEEAVERVRVFYKSQYYKDLVPLDGAVEGVKRLKDKGHKLVIVTSTHESALEAMYDSLAQHYPGCFNREDIYLTHTFGGSGKKRTKPEICAEIGARTLVDDHVGNLQGCRERDVHGILMRRPWNRTFSAEILSAEGIIPVESWQEVVEQIDNLQQINKDGSIPLPAF